MQEAIDYIKILLHLKISLCILESEGAALQQIKYDQKQPNFVLIHAFQYTLTRLDST